jgi:hypothetical protein
MPSDVKIFLWYREEEDLLLSYAEHASLMLGLAPLPPSSFSLRGFSSLLPVCYAGGGDCRSETNLSGINKLSGGGAAQFSLRGLGESAHCSDLAAELMSKRKNVILEKTFYRFFL